LPSFLNSLKNALTALKKHPKLFIPKILLAFAWGALLLLIAEKTIKLINLKTQKILIIEKFQILLNELTILFALFILLFLIDVFVNALYPLLVKAVYLKQKVSILKSMKTIALNTKKSLIPIIISFIIGIIVLLPFILLFSFALLIKNTFLIVLTLGMLLLTIFLITVALYFVYPIAVIEKTSFQSIFQSIKNAKKNFKPVSLAVIVSMVLSLLTLFLAVSFEKTTIIGFSSLIAFLTLRVINAIISTYQFVLMPVIYLDFEKKLELKT
jgi:hypothetical protein